MELKTNVVKAAICFVLLFISATLLFVPAVDGADEIKGMFVMLTAIAVRDYFGGVQSDKRVAEVKEAYSPTPSQSFVREE